MCMEHTVRRVAERIGLPPRTVRYYDHIGLVCPAKRSEAGYRLYSAEDEGKLHFVRQAKGFGFSLDQIRGLIAAAENGSCDGVTSELDGLLERKIEEITTRIDDLRLTRNQLIAYRKEHKSGCRSEGHNAFCACLEGSPLVQMENDPLARNPDAGTTPLPGPPLAA